ncbi:MAG: hypothetical protein JWM44_4438 [Bacilli bacterium]|nr:hypothetical protein [Bacilli bacterium]
MKKLFSLLLVFALSVSMFSGISFAKEPENEVPQSNFYAPTDNTITIDAKLSDKKSKKEGKWETDFSSYITLHKKYIDKETEVTYELLKLSQDGYKLESVNGKTKAIFKKFDYNKPEKILSKLEKLDNGQYQLVIKATYEQSQSNVLGATKSILFTVTDNEIKDGWDQLASFMAPAERPDKSTSIIVDPQSKNYGKMNVSVNLKEPVKGRVTALSTVSASGKWNTYDRNGNPTINVKNARVEVLYRDSFYIWRTAAVTYTDYYGNWSTSYTPPSDHNLWEIRVYAKSPNYGEVQNASSNTYYGFTQYSDLSSGGNIGTWNVTQYSAAVSAFLSYDDMIRAKDMLKVYRDPGNATIQWDTTFTDGSYYTAGGKVHLNQFAPTNITTTIHELGHNWMYNIYGSMPSHTCNSPHYFDQAAIDSGGCAWTEGWASMVSFYVNNSPLYYYDGGGVSYSNLEDTSGYTNSGDRVEGRILGSLWDLYDSVNDGQDTRSYPFSYIYLAMYARQISNFADYWSEWKTLGYDQNAKYSLWQNSIMYDNTTPTYPQLLANTPVYINGESSKVYKVIGTGAYPVFETSFYSQSTDTYLELYSDANLTNMLTSDDDSAGNLYSRISNYYLNNNQTYYIKVRNYTNGNPVYAKLTMSLGGGGSSFPLLTQSSPGYINGAASTIYQINGTGSYAVIQTWQYQASCDTYLELYTDAGLTNMVTYDDDSNGNLYSKISNYYLNSGQIYYLKVRNYSNGNAVYAQVTLTP